MIGQLIVFILSVNKRTMKMLRQFRQNPNISDHDIFSLEFIGEENDLRSS